MLSTRNFGIPALDPLSLFLVKGSGFITFHKVTWNRFVCLAQILIFFLDGYTNGHGTCFLFALLFLNICTCMRCA